MARPSLADDRKVFLAALGRRKEAVGNLTLRERLGWKEDRYWKVHSSLVEDKRIIPGRGRGGSVRKAG
jgi:type I restriction enzyme M protein